MMRPVNLIGRGRIGAAVADWLKGPDSHVLQSVIGRTGTWRPAPLTIDAAGPQALRTHGAALLAEGDLWSVGAAALIDDDLRGRLAEVAGRTGHEVRLFTGWIAGPTLAPAGANARLHIEQQAPRLGPARRACSFPDRCVRPRRVFPIISTRPQPRRWLDRASMPPPLPCIARKRLAPTSSAPGSRCPAR